MRKQISKSMILIVVTSVLIFAMGTLFLFFDNERRDSRNVVSRQVDYVGENYLKLMNNDETLDLNMLITQSRISLINPEGVVVYDNQFPLDKIDNHNDRIEVIEARANGRSYSERMSDSYNNITYYEAKLLADGMVIRISIPIKSFVSITKLIAPFITLTLLFVVFIAYIISNRVVKRIVSPIEKVDLESDLQSPYIELDYYFSEMRSQRERHAQQSISINRRNETINSILNTMQEGFAIVDSKRNLFLANQSFLKLMGVKSYTINDPLSRFIVDAKLLKLVDKALLNEGSRYKYTLNDRTYQIYVNPSSILNDDVVILYFVDVTMEYLNQTYREQFSANVSHELKTPLTIIKGIGELIAQGLTSEANIRDFGNKIEVQSERLLSMIDNIMLISKLDENKIEVAQEIVNMETITRMVLEHLQDKLEAKEIHVALNLRPLYVKGNTLMLDEMLYNLIDNAIKYNRHGGVIDISLSESDFDVVFTISNDGDKIQSKDRAYIFDRFYRSDASRNKQTGGTGLGLSIVKHIVLVHQGTIQILDESKSTFEVRLPQINKQS